MMLVHPLWVLLGPDVLIIGASLLPAAIAVTRSNIGWLFLSMFATTLGYIVYLPSTLLFSGWQTTRG